MQPTVLIAFATKHGSTRDVATEVAGRLSAHGIVTYTCPAVDVHSLEGYDGVVVGSAIYTGRLHAEARDFLHRFRGELATCPLAVFAIGPRTLADEDVTGSRRQFDAALTKEPNDRVGEIVETERGGADRITQLLEVAENAFDVGMIA